MVAKIMPIPILSQLALKQVVLTHLLAILRRADYNSERGNWTFVTGTPSGAQTKIRSTVQDTVVALVNDLNASANASLNVATYNCTSLVLNITYDVIGTGGNAYTLAAGTYAGAVSGATLSGGASGGATATLVVGSATGTNPGVVAYYQQRRAYGYTLERPDTYFISRIKDYANFDTSNPAAAEDAIIGSPWAQQVNGIQFMTL